MKSTELPTYNIIDLFSGAGGLSYGFLQTGRFQVKAAFENDLNAQKTYKRNHKDTMIYDDVTEALTVDLGKIDVVIGGPPCQGFSNANRQKNHAISQNNSLVKKFIQIVMHLNPTAFVMENVSMFKSNTHRFYVDKDDYKNIKKYKIKTEPTEIPLLGAEYLFDGVERIAEDIGSINHYLWDEDDYLILNIIFKTRKNTAKLKKTLLKHRDKLLVLAEKLNRHCDKNDYIFVNENKSGKAIKHYFATLQEDDDTKVLIDSIKNIVMIQRMLSKAKEIYDNKIVVSEFSSTHGLVAKVTSMAVIDYIESILGAPSNGYNFTKGVLSAATFGVPQKRMRFVIMGIKKEKASSISLPCGTFNEEAFRTVKAAIKDIETVEVTVDVNDGNKGKKLPAQPRNISELGRQLRNSNVLYNHVSTATTEETLKKFKVLKQGQNFHNLPEHLKKNYSDTKRTQNSIYLRLIYDAPSGTVINVRKSMWIHPILNRALSIREAARLQTFPDSFIFCGTKDSQYQQVGNAVPPILARAIADHLSKYLDDGSYSL